MKQFHIISTHGRITANAATGVVIDIEPENDPESIEFLNSITQFNVEEWESQYPNETLEGQTVDILDIGYITKGGTIEPPEPEWREENIQR